jgi:hypothetical protein
MSSRPTKKSKHESAPVLGQVPKQIIPDIDGRRISPYGYFNEKVQRTPRYAETTNMFQAILQYNDPEKVKECLKNGADVNLQDENGQTPLMRCIHVHPMIIQNLLDHGADVFVQDYKGNTALFYAVKYVCFSFAETLLKKTDGQLINETNPDGQTPLMVIANEHWEPMEQDSIRWLLEHGANANHRDKFGNTALTLVIRGIDKSPADRFDESAASFIQILIEEGQAKVAQSDVDLARDIDRRLGRCGFPIPKVMKLLEEHVKP